MGTTRVVLAILLAAIGFLCAYADPLVNPVVPVPVSATYGSGWFPFNMQTLTYDSSINSQLLETAFARFQRFVFKFGPGSAAKSRHITLIFQVDSANEDLQFGVSEEHVITSDEANNSATVKIQAKSVFGAIRALETLKQLTVFDDIHDQYYLIGVPFTVKDQPRFKWRGLLIDSARHYLDVSAIKRQIDAMAFVKMNTLHWHTVDAQSFPVQSNTYPKLASEGAYRFPAATYNQTQIADVVEYARERGIRVVAEFDVPGHTASWGKGIPGIVAPCPGHLAANINNFPLDVTQNLTLEVVENLIKEMTGLFPDSYIHTGGDEVVGSCWTGVPAIAEWMRQNSISTASQLQTYFEKKVEKFAQQSWNRTVVFWQDVFDNAGSTKFDATRSVFQIWKDISSVKAITAAGYRAVSSSGWYLDKYHPNGDPNVYHFWDTWQSMYTVDPTSGLTASEAKLVLGGEAAMWGEYVDSDTIDPQVWPRAAAVAERLWSAASVSDMADAQRRMPILSCSLRQLGISSVPLGPGYCMLPHNRG